MKKINVMQQGKTRCCVPEQDLFHGVWTHITTQQMRNTRFDIVHG
jgi:hypothetical protein